MGLGTPDGCSVVYGLLKAWSTAEPSHCIVSTDAGGAHTQIRRSRVHELTDGICRILLELGPIKRTGSTSNVFNMEPSCMQEGWDPHVGLGYPIRMPGAQEGEGEGSPIRTIHPPPPDTTRVPR